MGRPIASPGVAWPASRVAFAKGSQLWGEVRSSDERDAGTQRGHSFGSGGRVRLGFGLACVVVERWTAQAASLLTQPLIHTGWSSLGSIRNLGTV
eukprot:CAMPEP_0119373816 /NCGR_PEP_ID=MMETSP1334-20130426/27855_1 /TAXON_ID=127549 /ORGANISM="Calcidiscus leptoporus, Strain RCC1130" /LENGTH=94 /DNA_ID=CAMNT_0007391691 /DNA_START=1 /DNA_END=282 /DNA_ORIENTATION=-